MAPPQGSPNEKRIVTEETPLRPVGEYEITKTESDKMVIRAGEEGLITYSIVRPSNIFGENMPNSSLRALGKMIHKGFFFYIGPPGAIATYVHVNDVVKVLEICGTDPRAKGRTFNLSNDCLMEEMIEGMATSLKVKNPRLRLPEPVVSILTRIATLIIPFPLTQSRINALVTRTEYPSQRLQEELGFIPRFSVPKTIGEVVECVHE